MSAVSKRSRGVAGSLRRQLRLEALEDRFLLAEVLPRATWASGTLPSSGSSSLYQVDSVAAGTHLIFQLDGAGVTDTNEIYVRYGAAPNPGTGEYDAAGKESNSPDQYTEILSARAGTYYVLARCVYDGATEDGYKVRWDDDTTLPTLTLGTEATGTLPERHDFDLYRVVMLAGQHLIAQLDASGVTDTNSLYVNFGSLPQTDRYDAAGLESNVPDQYAGVTPTQAGTYYVLVRCEYDGATASSYRLRADDDATLPTLALGIEAMGTLPERHDFDLYRVVMPAGRHLITQLDASGVTDTNSLYVRFGALPREDAYDAAGSEANVPDQYAGVLPTQAGVYYVLVRCEYDGASASSYRVRADDDATLPTLTLGVETAGTLPERHDFDLYRVVMPAGQHLIAQLDASGVTDTNTLYLRLGNLPREDAYDTAGVEPNVPDQYAAVRPTQAGVYYVLVRCEYDGATASSYRLRVDDDATLPTLALGVNQAGTLPERHDFDLYRVAMPAGGHLIAQLDASGVTDTNSLYLRFGSLPRADVYDAAGLEPNVPDQYAEVLPTQAGVYYVLVRCEYDGATASSYAIRADDDATLPTLTLGEEVTGVLAERHDLDLYRVVMPAGGHLIAQFNASGVSDTNSLYLRKGLLPRKDVYDGAGLEPYSPDQYAEVLPTQAAVYYVLVRCEYDGATASSYRLRADDDTTLPTLTLGVEATGVLAERYDSDLYRVPMPGGSHLMVQFDGSGVSDTNSLYLHLGTLPRKDTYDAAGVEPYKPDQYTEVLPTQAGVYYVLVRCEYDGATTGSYRLRADDDTTLPTLGLGVEATGVLAERHDFDLYRVPMPAGGHLMVQLDASGVSDTNVLYLHMGTLPRTDDYDAAGLEPYLPDQYTEVFPTQAGTYYVLVRCDYDGATSSSYHLRADDDTTLPTLTLGVPATGNLAEDHDFDLYRVVMPAGQRLIVGLDSASNWDSNELYVRYGRLPTASAYTVAGNNPYHADQAAEIASTQAGTYYILVRCDSDLGAADDYQLWTSTNWASIGLYDPNSSSFFLRNLHDGGDADWMFTYGIAGVGWIQIAGDWDGDGFSSVGMYDPVGSVFYLKNTNAAGGADYLFSFGIGGAGWIPLVGDWNGDGYDSIGLYEPATSLFFFKNAFGGGPADLAVQFGVGSLGWIPIIGDWDGLPGDGFGFYEPATSLFFLKNAYLGGPAEEAFQFGVGSLGWIPLAGNWDGLPTGDGVGFYVPSSSTFFLKNEHAGGDADWSFSYGVSGLGWRPVIGSWMSVGVVGAAAAAAPQAEISAVDQVHLAALALPSPLAFQEWEEVDLLAPIGLRTSRRGTIARR